jgi:hypothetical protein
MVNHLLVFSFFFLTSCISVKVPLGPLDKIKNLKFQEPTKPYTQLISGTADYSWISTDTGNTIAILSECKDSPISLKDVAIDTAKAIDQLDIIRSEPHSLKKYPGYFVLARGLVDNSKVEMSIITLQTSKCLLTLTYGGLAKNFAKENEIFETFLANLVIP